MTSNETEYPVSFSLSSPRHHHNITGVIPSNASSEYVTAFTLNHSDAITTLSLTFVQSPSSAWSILGHDVASFLTLSSSTSLSTQTMATNTSSTSTAISSPPQASSTTNVGPYPERSSAVLASSTATSLAPLSMTLSAAMSSSTTTHHHSHSPAIAGGVVGGLGGLLVLVVILLWLSRRHRKPKVAPSAEFMAYAAALRSPAPTPDVVLMRASSPEPDSPRHASHDSHTDPLYEKLREAVAQMRHLHPKGGESGGIVDELQGDDLFGVQAICRI